MPAYATRGLIQAVAIAAAGSGHAPTDVLTLSGGDGTATITVDTVDGSGGVLTCSVTTPGTLYSTGGTYAQASSTGSGIGFEALVIQSGRTGYVLGATPGQICYSWGQSNRGQSNAQTSSETETLEAFPSDGTAGQQFALEQYAGRPDAGRAILWQTAFSGTPTTVSLALQGALADVDGEYKTLDTSTSNSGEQKTVLGVQANFLRVLVTSHTGGTSPALAVKFLV